MRYIVWLLALLASPELAFAQSNFNRILAPGPHPVGLKVVEQYDRSRGYRSVTDEHTGKVTGIEQSRPIQTLIWYPAESSAGPIMVAEDYLRLGGTSEDFGLPTAKRAELETAFISSQVAALSPGRARAELAASMQAHKHALEKSGKFPVVIYAPSYRSTSFENADLCEYLASHGYVVIASPSTGQSPSGMKDDLEGVEAQVGDIRFLIGYAHTLPQADTSRLAVMGFSWGGLANAMVAAKDARVDALVSLDGSLRTYPEVIEQSRYLTPDRVTAPMLYVAASPKQIEDLSPGLNMETSFLNRMKYADLYRVTVAPYVHGNFSVMFGQRLRASYGNYDNRELSVANGWVETYVLNFLDAYLKNAAASRAFLDTPVTKVGAPAHLLTVHAAKAQSVPPTRTAFAAELAVQGFEDASAVYAAFKKRDPRFSVPEDEMNTWGYKLLRNGDARSSVAILRLNAELHPDSWNAFDSLGEAYAKAGSKALAISAYRQSLALSSSNVNAVEQLRSLGVTKLEVLQHRKNGRTAR